VIALTIIFFIRQILPQNHYFWVNIW
jgi:hypothetical protein